MLRDSFPDCCEASHSVPVKLKVLEQEAPSQRTVGPLVRQGLGKATRAIARVPWLCHANAVRVYLQTSQKQGSLSTESAPSLRVGRGVLRQGVPIF